MKKKRASGTGEKFELKGTPASPGVVIGEAYVVHTRIRNVPRLEISELPVSAPIHTDWFREHERFIAQPSPERDIAHPVAFPNLPRR